MPATRQRRATAAAWATSIALHTLFAAAVLWSGLADRPAGVADASLAGIELVLREADEPSSPRFVPAPVSPAPERTEPLLAQPPKPVDSGPPMTPDEAAAPGTPADALAAQPPATRRAPAARPRSTRLAALLPELWGSGDGGASGGAGGDSSGGEAGRGAGANGPSRRLPPGVARVSVFGLPGEGRRFVYAFDRSISMRGAPLRAAKQELIASLEALGPTHEFQTLFFNTTVQAFDLTGGRNRIARGTEQNKDRAARFVGGVTAVGGTVRLDALRRALAMRPDVVFFLSDADDPMLRRDVRWVLERAIGGGVVINAIEFGVGPSTGTRNFLVELADRTGGGHVYVDTTRLRR
ncbi:MAG: hypothetical protein AAF805_04990 [Planctomycetota bacterium]